MGNTQNSLLRDSQVQKIQVMPATAVLPKKVKMHQRQHAAEKVKFRSRPARFQTHSNKKKNLTRRRFSTAFTSAPTARRVSNTLKKLKKASKSRVVPKKQPKHHTDYYIMRQAFNLFAQGKHVITVTDLKNFFDQYSLDSFTYEEVREMVHRALNDYEVSFEDFQRILMREPHFSEGPRSGVPSTEDYSIQPLPAQEQKSTGALVAARSSGRRASLDQRALIEHRKHMYGVYKPKHSQTHSFAKKPTSCDYLDFIINEDTGRVNFYIKRSLSVNSKLSVVDQQYFALRQVFNSFDVTRQGHLDYFDILQVMNSMNLRAKPSQVQQLFLLLGKTKKDSLSFQEFLQLYKMCQ